MKREQKHAMTVGGAMMVPLFLILGVYFVRWLWLQFEQNCGGYLKRAANANTVELAHRELSKAIQFLEIKDLTVGSTSVFFQTPDEDIGYWYDNLKAAQKELATLKAREDVSALEQSNTLLKLRDTLTDHSGQNGSEKLVTPDGISRYPNNGFLGMLMLTTGLVGFVGFVIFGTEVVCLTPK